MKVFEELTNKNFELFAAHHYNNPECMDVEEFKEDLSRFKYLKRLLKRYETDQDLQERLILNHLISFYNVFQNEAAARLLFFRVGEEYHSLLKTFLVFLNKMPEQVNENLYSSDIQMDTKVIEILRNLK